VDSILADTGVVLAPLSHYILNPFIFKSGSGYGYSGQGRLTALAQCFGEFDWEHLEIEYVPEVSLAGEASAPGGSQGSVILAYFDNPAAALGQLTANFGTSTSPTILAQSYLNQLLYQPNKECSVYRPFKFNVPVKRGWKQNDPFEAMGAYPTAAAAGMLSVALHDFNKDYAGRKYGFLRANFRVRFRKPTYAPGVFANIFSLTEVRMTTFAGVSAGTPVTLTSADSASTAVARVSALPTIFVGIPEQNAEFTVPASPQDTFFRGTPYIFVRVRDTSLQNPTYYGYSSMSAVMNAAPIRATTNATSAVVLNLTIHDAGNIIP
jgi:hypothetical protein